MKNVNLLLILSLMLVFSCEVERLETDLLPANKQANQSNNNANHDNDHGDDEGACETLFAKASDDESSCFIDDGFNRWGWTIGPLDGGTYFFDLYAGAGGCDTDKGTLVGLLKIEYDELTETVTVEYDAYSGYTLSETHLYVGSEPYPVKPNGQPTVAPGQYPYKHNLDAADEDSFTITDVMGDIYVIAHGVICEDDDDGGQGGGGVG
ncbi:MAG: hypothetical protein HKN40_11995 [Winogradskyella sp.]|uniref:hypothetical protein n=1 Tax=Winogradskyella sp. TaxID=1883156 RepID=UPI00182955DC|nr:hypothetical protein [Winogradskyella sp.]